MAALTPIATLNDNGRGVNDIDGALAAPTDLVNDFANDGNCMLYVSNGTASPLTVTVKSQPDPYGRGGTADTNNDEALTIAAGKMGVFPFLNINGFNAGGRCSFVLSSIASGVKVGLYRVVKLR